MLSSPNSGILLPQLSPPVSLGNDETFLHYDLLSQYCLLQESPMANKPVSLFIKDTSTGDDDQDRPLHDKHTTGRTLSSVLETKDRHSKIFTAQGPRDRRVRLSKDIARKFFDLQDLLGFDRASKTLDWLLTKSEPAIKELVPISTRYSLMCYSSECENLESKKKKKNKSNSVAGAAKKKRKRRNTSGKPKLLEAKPLDDQIIMAAAKETRAKARARARERTKEKQFLREMIINQARTSTRTGTRTRSEVESCKTSLDQYSNSHHKEATDQMNGYSFSCLQPNLIISRESSSNFSQWSPNTTTDNWDISSAVTSSCFHPLTNTSTSSSSLVLQIQSNPFDLSEYNSNNNHGLMW